MTEFCPIGYTLDIISKKWMLYVMREFELSKGKPLRYTDLFRRLSWGINSKILSERLKELEKEKILVKKQYAQIPPKVEYSLTKKGQELIDSFASIEKWSRKWNKCIRGDLSVG